MRLCDALVCHKDKAKPIFTAFGSIHTRCSTCLPALRKYTRSSPSARKNRYFPMSQHFEYFKSVRRNLQEVHDFDLRVALRSDAKTLSLKYFSTWTWASCCDKKFVAWYTRSFQLATGWDLCCQKLFNHFLPIFYQNVHVPGLPVKCKCSLGKLRLNWILLYAYEIEPVCNTRPGLRR